MVISLLAGIAFLSGGEIAMPQSDDPVQHGSSDGSLDGIKSEGWTASSRKGGRDQIGTGDDFKSVHMDGLRRYPHLNAIGSRMPDECTLLDGTDHQLRDGQCG
jgi:hypothetical protein